MRDLLMNVKRIIQIIPAVGWTAIYSDDAKENPKGKNIDARPLVCWALVELETGDREVVAMDADDLGEVTYCSDMNNFLGICPPGGDLASWEETANAQIARKENK